MPTRIDRTATTMITQGNHPGGRGRPAVIATGSARAGCVLIRASVRPDGVARPHPPGVIDRHPSGAYGRAMSSHLPSWRDTPTTQAILAFVAAAARVGDPGYVPPADR